MTFYRQAGGGPSTEDILVITNVQHICNKALTIIFVGYALSAKALETILKRYSRAMDDGRILIAFDDFVSMSVRLRAYTGLLLLH